MQKQFRLAHGQDARAFERFENQGQIIPFRRTDEKNVAGFEFGEFLALLDRQVIPAPARSFFTAEFQCSLEPLDLQPSPVDDLVLQFVQLGAERVLAHDPNNDRRLCVGKRPCRPFNELDEVKQVAGFGFILAGRCRERAARMDKTGHPCNPG